MNEIDFRIQKINQERDRQNYTIGIEMVVSIKCHQLCKPHSGEQSI